MEWHGIVPRPEMIGLMFAIGCSLQGLTICQRAGETLFELLRPIWRQDALAPSFESLPDTYSFGRELVHPDPTMNQDVVRWRIYSGLAEHFAGCLYSLLALRANEADEPQWAAYLPPWIARLSTQSPDNASDAIDELVEAGWRYEGDPCPFVVDALSTTPVMPIDIDGGIERRSCEGHRLRAYRFRYKVANNEASIHSELRVAQIVNCDDGSAWEWDTIWEHNEELPFWPRAVPDETRPFCHRCALHYVDGCLEWTDWPQIPVKRCREIGPTWRFLTGVFRRTSFNMLTRYSLVACVEWAVNWNDER